MKKIEQYSRIDLSDFGLFPSTRYQGSKRKILPWIYEAVKELKFQTILDVFGGSASVSYMFKKMRKEVTYNDYLKFNYIIGKTLIENQDVKFSDKDIQNILSEQKGTEQYNFIENQFKGIYYFDEENRWLDKVIGNILTINGYPLVELEFKRCIALYSLFQACLVKRPFNLFHRRNLSLRLRKVKRTFGNKTTWDKPFEEHFKRFINEANLAIFDSGTKCLAVNKPFIELCEDGYDLVYIDPPYLKKNGTNETSNYLKCYHFLEGISNYECWGDHIDFQSICNGFKTASKGHIFSKHVVYETFEQLIEKFRKSIIVLSYKKNGIPSIDFLIKLLKKFKGQVVTKSMHYKYALNRQNGDSRLNREVLIIGI